MNTGSEPSKALNFALMKLLRPLMRLLLRHSMPFSAFEELAKRACLEAAMNDFTIPGKKPSISRASILTGLTRKDVQRLLRLNDEPRVVPEKHYNHSDASSNCVNAL